MSQAAPIATVREVGHGQVASKLSLARGLGGSRMHHYSAYHRDLAMRRAEAVDRFRKARRQWSGQVTAWLPTLIARLRRDLNIRVSARSLYRWGNLYHAPEDMNRLIDQRGGDQRSQADDAAWQFFQEIFLDERKPKVKHCWARTREYAEAHGLDWVSYRQCCMELARRIPVELQAQFRDPTLYRSAYKPRIEQHPEAYPARTCWLGDHCICDFFVRHPTTGKPARPWLTAWMDWRTRRITGWCMTLSPDSSTILAALRHALLHQRDENMGGPDRVIIDNGADWAGYTFAGMTKAERRRVQRTVEGFRLDETNAEGIFKLLGITAHFCEPYRPDGKSRVERWFGTLHDQFDRSMPTYCGSYHGDRPETLQKSLKTSLPDFEHVRQRLADFIDGYNASRDHHKPDMRGLSPDEALALWAPDKRAYASTVGLDHCLQIWAQPQTVSKQGVSIQVGGRSLSYGYVEPKLRPYKGRTKAKVRIAYDPSDLRTVRVYDEKWRFICEPELNDVGGGDEAITKGDVARAHRKISQYRAKRREVAAQAHHEYLSSHELVAQEASQQAATDRQKPADPPLKPIRTPLDGAAADDAAGRKAASAARQREPIALTSGEVAPVSDSELTDESDEELAPVNLSDLSLGEPSEGGGEDGNLLDELEEKGGLSA